MPKPIDMPELIDKKVLLEILCFGCSKYSSGVCRNVQGRCAEYTIIKLMTTIEAEPVRHGRWIKQENGSNLCSVCGVTKVSHLPFCGHCGAKMNATDEEKAYQAFKDIPAANPWISCSERMMPDGERVLVRLTNGEVFVMSRSGDVISDGLRHLTDLSGVERWMPIPDAYEPSESEAHEYD